MGKVTKRVFYGTNRVQEFWQVAEKEGNFALIRNLQESLWWAIKDDSTLFYDQDELKALREKGRMNEWPILCARTPEALAEKLKAQYGIEVVFDRSRRWVERRGHFYLEPA